MATYTQTLTVEETKTKKPPPPPLPSPMPSPPPPPPYSLTETCYDAPIVIAELITCKCKKNQLVHQFKVRARHPKMEISSPTDSKPETPRITFDHTESKWSHTVSLVPCWHYHFKSDGSIHFMNKCPFRSQLKQTDLVLEEKCLEATSIQTLLKYIGKEKVHLWPTAVKQRFGSWTLQNIIKMMKEELSSSQKFQFLQALFHENVVDVIEKQNANYITKKDFDDLAKAITLKSWLDRLLQPPFQTKGEKNS